MAIVAVMSVGNIAMAVTKIELAVVTKPGSAHNIVADKFKKLIEIRSMGGIEVKIRHSGYIGSETEILQLVQKNKLQMAVVTDGPFDGFDPIVRVISYPFLFRNNDQVDLILDGPLGKEILKSLEESNLKGLCFSENGFRNVTNSKRAIKNPADVKGLKIRVMESDIHKAIWRALDANPMPIRWPIYNQLQKGLVDGQENPLWVMEVYKMFQTQKYLTLSRHVYSCHIDVASLTWWNSLSESDQQMIQETMYDAALFQRKDNRSKDAARLKMLKEKGMMVEKNPNIEAFRAKVADLKNLELYSNPKVKAMLEKLIAATR
jgi:tripartite ATP-independent transporter DctP family solute receptor